MIIKTTIKLMANTCLDVGGLFKIDLT